MLLNYFIVKINFMHLISERNVNYGHRNNGNKWH